jgi:transcription elongation factor GreA
MVQYPMTPNGEKRLRDELLDLTSHQRPEVIAAIAEARAHGDLKENAEYHAAREKQSFVEGRIQDIEAKLSQLQVIDVTKMENTGKVIFGATVTLLDVAKDASVTYQIVGEDESDISAGKISVTSPLSRAVVGKYAEDEVDVKTPQGFATYEIEKVEYI